MNDSSTLQALLEALKKRQSWCPICGGEMVHDEGCELEGYWYKKETEDED